MLKCSPRPAFAVSIDRERPTPHVRKPLAFGEIELASTQLIGTVPQSSFTAFANASRMLPLAPRLSERSDLEHFARFGAALRRSSETEQRWNFQTERRVAPKKRVGRSHSAGPFLAFADTVILLSQIETTRFL